MLLPTTPASWPFLDAGGMCFRCLSCTGGWLHDGRWRRRIQQRRRPPTESPGWCLFRLLFIFGAEFHLLLMATGLRSNSFFQTQRNTYHYIKEKEIKWLIQYLKRIWPVQKIIKSKKWAKTNKPFIHPFSFCSFISVRRLSLSPFSLRAYKTFVGTTPVSWSSHSSPFTYTHLSYFPNSQ